MAVNPCPSPDVCLMNVAILADDDLSLQERINWGAGDLLFSLFSLSILVSKQLSLLLLSCWRYVVAARVDVAWFCICRYGRRRRSSLRIPEAIMKRSRADDNRCQQSTRCFYSSWGRRSSWRRRRNSSGKIQLICCLIIQIWIYRFFWLVGNRLSSKMSIQNGFLIYLFFLGRFFKTFPKMEETQWKENVML